MLDQTNQATEPTYNEPSMLKSEIPRHDVFLQTLGDFQAEVDTLRHEAEVMVALVKREETRLDEIGRDWKRVVENQDSRVVH